MTNVNDLAEMILDAQSVGDVATESLVRSLARRNGITDEEIDKAIDESEYVGYGWRDEED